MQLIFKGSRIVQGWLVAFRADPDIVSPAIITDCCIFRLGGEGTIFRRCLDSLFLILGRRWVATHLAPSTLIYIHRAAIGAT